MPPRKHPTKVSPKLEAELRDRLEELLDQADDVREKRAALSKALGAHIKVIESSIILTRRQLKGEDLDQMAIPGTQVPKPAEDPLVREILEVAGGIVDAQQEEEKEHAEKDEEELLDPGATKRDAASRSGLIAWEDTPSGWSGNGAKKRKYSVEGFGKGWSWTLHGTFTGAGMQSGYPTAEHARNAAEEREAELRGRARG